MRIIENNLVFTKYVRRDLDDYYEVAGAKIGNVLNVRKPPRYVGRTGQALAIEDATETSVPVVLTTQRGVDIEFSSADLALSVDDFQDRFIKPAIANVANGVDSDGLLLYQTVYNEIGTPGTTPTALLTYLQAGAALDNDGTPRDGERAVVMSPTMQAYLVDALKGLFQDSTDIARQYREGTMGKTIGFKFSMDQNVWAQVGGPLGGAPVVHGANQTGASLITNGWTASAAARLNQGDTFTIASVYAVNPQSRRSTGSLQQFVVTANVSSDGSGNATIPIYPSIITSGAFQTVDSIPADGAAITPLSGANISSPQGLAFHKEAFVMACADLPLPDGVDKAARVRSKQLGISIRMIRAYDINTDRWPCRLDFLYGWAALYPEFACRIAA